LCVTTPNIVAIGHTITENQDFSIFKMAPYAMLDFEKFENLAADRLERVHDKRDKGTLSLSIKYSSSRTFGSPTKYVYTTQTCCCFRLCSSYNSWYYSGKQTHTRRKKIFIFLFTTRVDQTNNETNKQAEGKRKT